MSLPPDLEQYVRQCFAAPERLEALQLLNAAVLHDGKKPDHRMLRSAVVASDNTLGGLKERVTGLATDYRDVIVAGEYEMRDGELVRIRDLSKPIQLDE